VEKDRSIGHFLAVTPVVFSVLGDKGILFGAWASSDVLLVGLKL
jgi:hypothetical protein